MKMSIPRKAKVERLKASGAAHKLLQSLGFPHPREIDLRDLAMDRNVLVREGDIQGAEGRLLRKKKHGIIHIRKGITPEGRRRFTIAHELGHWELHEAYSQFLCDSEDMRDYGWSPLEVEANCFAAELLMPNTHFRDACGNHAPSISLIEELADAFQTTLTATAIRYADVSKRRVVVVYHQDGVVRWCYSDEKKSLPYVMAGRPVPQFSSASLDPTEVAAGMDHYEDADWFPQLQWGKDGINEETKRMKVLRGGLTLLWFP